MNHLHHRISLPDLADQPNGILKHPQRDDSQVAAANHQIQVRLGDLISPLVTAVKQRKQWIDDFSEDTVTVPADLYEVIRAFNGFQVTNHQCGRSGFGELG